MSQYIFYFLSFLAILSALMVVVSKNPVHSVLYLIITFFARIYPIIPIQETITEQNESERIFSIIHSEESTTEQYEKEEQK